jgi:hypothetical protein
MLDTPVLFLIFNRPDTTEKVFEAIRLAKPRQLFVAADGPRINKEGEREKCEAARKIATNVDWDCEVKTLFRSDNRGCGHAPAEAINWFFEYVEQGIILEDDVLPSGSFFNFCEELLEKYKHDYRIMHIAGSQFLDFSFTTGESYILSDYSPTWGWATWRRAWQGYDYNISSWADKKQKEKIRRKFSLDQYLFFEGIFDMVCNKNIPDVWDYQWLYHRIIAGGIGIIPLANLTKNIGFNENATHTFSASEEMNNIVLEEISFPLVHPAKLIANKEYDAKLARKYYRRRFPAGSNIPIRIFKKLLYLVGYK